MSRADWEMFIGSLLLILAIFGTMTWLLHETAPRSAEQRGAEHAAASSITTSTALITIVIVR